MLDNIYEFACAERIEEKALIDHASQLIKERNKPEEDVLRNVRAVGSQKGILTRRIGIFDRMARKDVAALRKEIVAQERIAGTIGQCDDTKVRM